MGLRWNLGCEMLSGINTWEKEGGQVWAAEVLEMQRRPNTALANQVWSSGEEIVSRRVLGQADTAGPFPVPTLLRCWVWSCWLLLAKRSCQWAARGTWVIQRCVYLRGGLPAKLTSEPGTSHQGKWWDGWGVGTGGGGDRLCDRLEEPRAALR